MPQIALSSDFLKAMGQLPRQQQKKVRSFMDKFRNDPTPASINYEPIHDCRDPKVRTVRIDLQYRAVVIHPPQGDVYLCVWVDNHQEAMDWAKNKVFEVNALTGAFQMWEALNSGPAEAKDTISVSSRPIPEERLLSGHTDDLLLLFGVPVPLLPAVRALRTEADLDGLCRYLPQEASDALYLLAAGYGVDQAIDELDRLSREQISKLPPVNTNDFATALQKPQSKQQFKVVESADELAEILAAPLDQWRVFLHPSQDLLIRMESNGAARVLGGAGTGKTVVAMHRAKYLAKQEGFLPKGQRILFTTYTVNLAADIGRNLDNLCGPERARIDVSNLHGWAKDYLVSRGMKVKIVPEDKKKALWIQVASSYGSTELPRSFYQEEWDKVIQAQDVTDLDGYLKARRVGRGTGLTRSDRKQVWTVMNAYRKGLDERGHMEYSDVIREARLHIEKNPGRLPYRTVIADEVQDFRQADLALLRAIVPEGTNDIFVVGDAHQRIYGHQASLSRACINVRGGRSRRLTLNYRTTQNIRSWAEKVLEGLEVDDLDEGTDTTAGYHSLRIGQKPERSHFETREAEAGFLVEKVKLWLTDVKASEICIVARTNEMVDEYAEVLDDAGISTEKIKTDSDKGPPDAVRLATMHRVKGLEFARVVIAGVQAGRVPLLLSDWNFADEAAKAAHVDGEKRLLYVAATRARDMLVICGHGGRSEVVG